MIALAVAATVLGGCVGSQTTPTSYGFASPSTTPGTAAAASARVAPSSASSAATGSQKVDSQATGPAPIALAPTAPATATTPLPESTRIPDNIPYGAPIVEFRARTGPDIIGHTYLVYGLQGKGNEILQADQIGLYPKNLSGFAVGVGGMAEATTYPVEYDLKIPPSVVYRRQLTDAEYERLKVAVQNARMDPPLWNWTRYNCNTFIADMAKEVGLETPLASTLMAPGLFVSQLRMMNSQPNG